MTVIVAEDQTMATTAPPKPKAPRESWADWAPDTGTLLTRQELVDALRALGVPVTERTIMYWEKVGALPRSVRRRYRGATRVVYPDWLVPLAARIPGLMRDHIPLHEIGAHLRPDGNAMTVAGPGRATASGGIATMTGTRSVPATANIAVEPSDADLEPVLAWLARRYQQASGFAVARVKIQITDSGGGRHTHSYPPQSK